MPQRLQQKSSTIACYCRDEPILLLVLDSWRCWCHALVSGHQESLFYVEVQQGGCSARARRSMGLDFAHVQMHLLGLLGLWVFWVFWVLCTAGQVHGMMQDLVQLSEQRVPLHARCSPPARAKNTVIAASKNLFW
jgi:hypothetical protein